MQKINIIEAEQEARRFLKRIKALKDSQEMTNEKTYNFRVFTDPSKETGAVKRASMDLTRALAKMRNNIYH